MSFQNQEIHDDLNEMQKLTEAQEEQFKQQNDNDYDQVGTSGYQEIIKRSRENSIDSARSRSRSINERKRNYNRQQNSNEEESPSNINQNSRPVAQRSNHFFEQNDEQNEQNLGENDLNSNNTTGVDFSKMNFNQSLQQLQEMVNKVEVPVIKLDNQSGYRHARYNFIDQQIYQITTVFSFLINKSSFNNIALLQLHQVMLFCRNMLFQRAYF